MTTTAAQVSNYKLFAANGRYIRTATQVTLPNGQVIQFMERMTKREAIAQAARLA